MALPQKSETVAQPPTARNTIARARQEQPTARHMIARARQEQPTARNTIARARQEQPTARHMIAGGSAELSANGAVYDSQGQARSASPLGTNVNDRESSERAEYCGEYFALSVLSSISFPANQGRRASLRLALAPGYRIPRLWRCACPWLSYFAPLALRD
jgi:hypothetical protein